MKFHFFAASIVLVFAVVLRVPAAELMILILVITLVLAFELINTAIEKMIDLVNPAYCELAGRVKDMAAGAVLVTAIGSVLIGLIIFWPYVKLIL